MARVWIGTTVSWAAAMIDRAVRSRVGLHGGEPRCRLLGGSANPLPIPVGFQPNPFDKAERYMGVLFALAELSRYRIGVCSRARTVVLSASRGSPLSSAASSTWLKIASAPRSMAARAPLRRYGCRDAGTPARRMAAFIRVSNSFQNH